MKHPLCEASGKISIMRINSVLAVLVAFAMSIYASIKGTQDQNFMLIVSWLIAGFVPKALQRFAENKASK